MMTTPGWLALLWALPIASCQSKHCLQAEQSPQTSAMYGLAASGESGREVVRRSAAAICCCEPDREKELLLPEWCMGGA